MKTFDKKTYERVLKKMIKPGEFCKITEDLTEDVGLSINDEVYVCGVRAIPENAEDPYTQRVKMLVVPIDKDNKLDTSRVMLLDPTRLKRLTTKRAKLLQQLMEDTFDGQSESTLN